MLKNLNEFDVKNEVFASKVMICVYGYCRLGNLDYCNPDFSSIRLSQG
jgi:hypothetical protein